MIFKSIFSIFLFFFFHSLLNLNVVDARSYELKTREGDSTLRFEPLTNGARLSLIVDNELRLESASSDAIGFANAPFNLEQGMF